MPKDCTRCDEVGSVCADCLQELIEKEQENEGMEQHYFAFCNSSKGLCDCGEPRNAPCHLPETGQAIANPSLRPYGEIKDELDRYRKLLDEISEISGQPFTETHEHLPAWIRTILLTRPEAAFRNGVDAASELKRMRNGPH